MMLIGVLPGLEMNATTQDCAGNGPADGEMAAAGRLLTVADAGPEWRARRANQRLRQVQPQRPMVQCGARTAAGFRLG